MSCTQYFVSIEYFINFETKNRGDVTKSVSFIVSPHKSKFPPHWVITDYIFIKIITPNKKLWHHKIRLLELTKGKYDVGGIGSNEIKINTKS